jgi:hypothetical protein
VTRPDKDTWSELAPHYIAGSFQLSLNKELPHQDHLELHPSRPTIDHTDTTSPSNAVTEDPWRKNEKIIIAHGVIASFGFLVILPAGSLVARWARALTPKWFKAHQMLMLMAMPVITIGWVLGPIAVMARQAPHLFDAHQVSDSPSFINKIIKQSDRSVVLFLRPCITFKFLLDVMFTGGGRKCFPMLLFTRRQIYSMSY